MLLDVLATYESSLPLPAASFLRNPTCHTTALSRSPLSSLGFKPGVNFVVPVWMKVQPLRTAAVGGLLPPDLPCRCAAACSKQVMINAQDALYVLL
jgi:hypothetical protein